MTCTLKRLWRLEGLIKASTLNSLSVSVLDVWACFLKLVVCGRGFFWGGVEEMICVVAC